MSITSSQGPTIKRRKLSHASTDVELLNTNDGPKNGAERFKGSDEEVKAGTVSQRPHNVGTTGARASTLAAGGMTKASIMQIQVNELLDEVKPDYESRLRKSKPLCDRIVQVINSIPERPSLPLLDAEKVLRKKYGIAIPSTLYRPEPDSKYTFAYQHPAGVHIRGRPVQQLGTRDGQTLEISVQMPISAFQEKDYLNYRAFHKRAYYVACIAAGLKESLGNDFECRYELLNGDLSVPVISLNPSNPKDVKILRNTRLLVNVVFPPDVGPLAKLHLNRNCVRKNCGQGSDKNDSLSPTPLYNSTLRTLASTSNVDRLIEQVSKRCEAFKDTCILGQIWLQQRGFSGEISEGGFGVSEWAHMCALLLTAGGHRNHPLFSERYSSIQLFKAMLQVLASRDLLDPLLVRASNLKIEKSDLPVLYDGEDGINVLAKMTKWSYKVLRHYAQLSLTAVNNRALDSFDSTFIVKVAEDSMQFDEIYSIDLSATGSKSIADIQQQISNLYEVLMRGLDDRITLLDIRQRASDSFELASSVPKQSKMLRNVEIRLLIAPDVAGRLIDHGPTAEEHEKARDYRSFWGEKSELRRFRDGSITEALVWSPKAPVILQIIQYLLAKHFDVLPASIEEKTPDLRRQRSLNTVSLSAEDAFKLLHTKYQDLSSKLHQMEGLPLPIRSVSPAGKALRSASIDNPLDPKISSPVDIIIQFDSSARWPDHLLAIQQTKVAFLAKISDLISETDSSLTTRIGLENTDKSTQGYYNTSFLDIISPSPDSGLSPIVFRLRIHHERELQLLQSHVADNTLPPFVRDVVSSALGEHKRTFMASPSHTSSIRNLVTHFSPLSDTIRLIKAWIASHNLSNHIPEAVLEIIGAHIFLHPSPWATPGNATTAFLRCIHFISRWDWASSPLLVDLSLSQDMTAGQATDLATRFQAWKKLDPSMNTMAWFIGTNIDSTGTIWTQNSKPARVVASRLTALARAVLELIKAKGAQMTETDWKSLFVSPLGDYDFVIHLRPSVSRGGQRSGRKDGKARFKNLQVQEDLDFDKIGHNVVSLYLEDLEKAFANTAVFFHGEGEATVAGLWRPTVLGEKNWRVRLGYSTLPYAGYTETHDGEAQVTAKFNADAVLAEIALLGEDMIEKITVKE